MATQSLLRRSTRRHFPTFVDSGGVMEAELQETPSGALFYFDAMDDAAVTVHHLSYMLVSSAFTRVPYTGIIETELEHVDYRSPDLFVAAGRDLPFICSVSDSYHATETQDVRCRHPLPLRNDGERRGVLSSVVTAFNEGFVLELEALQTIIPTTPVFVNALAGIVTVVMRKRRSVTF